jgi:hypothetical protein
MATAQTPATSHSREDDFLDWLESPFIRVAAYRQHGQWYAIAEDFDVVGIGKTELAAYRTVAEMTEAYLRTFHREHRTYADAWRKIPFRARLVNIVRGLVARSLQRTQLQLPFAEETRWPLPVAFSDLQ